MDGLGHNTESAGRLRTLVERLETIDDEKRAAAEAFNDVLKEAKGEGFDPTVIRKIVALRRQDAAKRKEKQAILDLYAHALGFDLF
jgi:uncharacterized protein (UPF0335 family)